MMTVGKILRTHRISFSGMTRAFSRNILRMYVSAAVGMKIIGGICRLFFFFLGDAPVSRKEIYDVISLREGACRKCNKSTSCEDIVGVILSLSCDGADYDARYRFFHVHARLNGIYCPAKCVSLQRVRPWMALISGQR